MAHSAMVLRLCIFYSFILGIYGVNDYQPQQIHIAVGDVNQDMVISWVTTDQTPNSIVEYGTVDLNYTANGTQGNFTNIGLEMREMYLHEVVLSGLEPDTRYYYHCGSDMGWSSLYTFKTWKTGENWPVRVVMYGDLGAENAQSLPRLQTDVQRGMYDAVIHVGDFAYNMQDQTGGAGGLSRLAHGGSPKRLDGPSPGSVAFTWKRKAKWLWADL
ncbi:hypothetical protein SK128_005463 [Halocaridina rubra]|uniref:Purple acid phosphatase N-terminal domain-containing protein n=1 Tax=Halocaridina rubra TaxID=373956 RepID=A0AAN8XHG7_HALRR